MFIRGPKGKVRWIEDIILQKLMLLYNVGKRVALLS
jgi:hypothetical protein